MSKYPKLIVNSNIIYKNSRIINDLCSGYGVTTTAVIKGFDGKSSLSKKMYDGGCAHVGSSRVRHLKKISKKFPHVPLMLIRIPMLSEVKDVVKYCDYSLNSEKKTLKKIDKECAKTMKKHKVILMRDLGDLREGVFTRDELVKLALFAENELKFVELAGIGTNLSCYGSIKPTQTNLSELAEDAKIIESLIGRRLEIVSGGATTTLPLVLEGKLPKEINHLRLGESIINTQDLPLYWDTHIEGLSKDSFVLQAEIIEINKKPTYPIGELSIDAFGNVGCYEDRGIRKRAIVALGNFDVGDVSKLIPKDSKIKVVGGSSDHTILDIEDCDTKYKLGDVVSFNLLYQAMVNACTSKDVKIIM